jgi:hypothetical protein
MGRFKRRNVGSKARRKATMAARGQFTAQPRADINAQPKKLPSNMTMAKNLGKAVVKDIANKRKRVTMAEYTDRLAICNSCNMREGDRCTHPGCGCSLSAKAWWDSERCPLPENKWKEAKLKHRQEKGPNSQ